MFVINIKTQHFGGQVGSLSAAISSYALTTVRWTNSKCAFSVQYSLSSQHFVFPLSVILFFCLLTHHRQIELTNEKVQKFIITCWYWPW